MYNYSEHRISKIEVICLKFSNKNNFFLISLKIRIVTPYFPLVRIFNISIIFPQNNINDYGV